MTGDAATVVSTYVHTRKFLFSYEISCTPFQRSQLLIGSAGTFLPSSSLYVPLLITRNNNQRFVLLHFPCLKHEVLVPVAERSEAWVCGRWPAEILGSNPTGGIDVYLLRLLCVVR